MCSFYYEVISVKGANIPFFTFVITYYFIFHGLFAIYTPLNVPHLPFSRDIGSEAVLFTLAFVGLQFAGYHIVSRTVRFRPSPLSCDPTAALILISWTLMVGYFAIHFVLQNYSVPSLPQLKMPCWYFALSTLSFLLLRRQLSLPHVVALVAVVGVKLSIDLMNGFLTPILFSVLIVLSAALSLKSFRTIIILGLIGVSLFGSYGYIKHFSKTVIKGERTYLNQFTQIYSLQGFKSSFDSLARRSSHLSLTSLVMERTPSLVPFDNRNPFLDAVINHVPRVLWPSKPREVQGNAFGKRYGILNLDDKQTSWNLPWTVDFYITFGPFLSVLSIFFLGGAFGLAVSWLSSRADQPFWFGVYSATLFPLFYQESNFSVMTGSVFSVLVFLLVAYRVAKMVLPLSSVRNA